jgi:hypothetical protein
LNLVLLSGGATSPDEEFAKAASLACYATVSVKNGQVRITRTAKDEAEVRSLDQSVFSSSIKRVVRAARQYSDSVKGQTDYDRFAASLGAAQRAAEAIKAGEARPVSLNGLSPFATMPAARYAETILERLAATTDTRFHRVWHYWFREAGEPGAGLTLPDPSEFVEAQARFLDEVTQRGLPQPARLFGIERPKQAARARPTAACVTILRSPGEFGVSVSLFDSAGELVARCPFTTRPMIQATGAPPVSQMPEPAPSAEVALAVSKSFLEYGDLAAAQRDPDGSRERDAVRSLLSSEICRPETSEPLELACRDMLLDLVRRWRLKSFVANLPDRTLIYLNGLVRDGKYSVSQFQKVLTEACGCELLTSGQTLVVRPRDPVEDEAFFTNRSVVGSVLDELRGHGGLTIGQAALAWAKAGGFTRNRGLLYLYRRIFSSLSAGIFDYYMNLTPSQVLELAGKSFDLDSNFRETTATVPFGAESADSVAEILSPSFPIVPDPSGLLLTRNPDAVRALVAASALKVDCLGLALIGRDGKPPSPMWGLKWFAARDLGFLLGASPLFPRSIVPDFQSLSKVLVFELRPVRRVTIQVGFETSVRTRPYVFDDPPSPREVHAEWVGLNVLPGEVLREMEDGFLAGRRSRG